jgi:hypothetical protein
MNRRLGGPLNWSWHFEKSKRKEQKVSYPCQKQKPRWSTHSILYTILAHILLRLRLSLWLHAMRGDVFGKWRNAPLMLSKWRWVVSFMSQLLYCYGKRPQYPLDRRQERPQGWYGYSGEQEKLWSWQNLSPDVPPFSPQCRHYTEWAVPTHVTWVTLWKTVSLFTAEKVYAGLQNCTKQLLVSACLTVHPSVCPHGTTQFPQDRFSWNLISDSKVIPL